LLSVLNETNFEIFKAFGEPTDQIELDDGQSSDTAPIKGAPQAKHLMLSCGNKPVMQDRYIHEENFHNNLNFQIDSSSLL
jgi:hypothetical protein